MEKQESKKKLADGPQISRMEPVTHGAYGGGMYGTEKDQQEEEEKDNQQQTKAPASESQSADGPVDKNVIKFKHHPPSTGDRDIDITGQSYIQ
ncbi:uncharacterized protein LOC107608280 [Arachis ipaensis]|uniref:Uncharacterized protein n=1 Tax=Arachis hypogaea TaxID=3818 RepID=A0A445CD09_ARAHY|nr:uncharacterized protein LOC107608280 [Arachis ipaensis]QHN93168.1 uncharacterized protein DS421_17g590380 [Arachis hypogaea]RYR48743.1 hypothetical protein Ahy_A07g034818 [Arachis hypogaea]